MMKTETTTVTVNQMFHNGNNWEHIEGASWEMEMMPGESFDDAVLRDSSYGDWPDDDDEQVRLVVLGDSMYDDDAFGAVFTAAELRSGKKI